MNKPSNFTWTLLFLCLLGLIVYFFVFRDSSYQTFVSQDSSVQFLDSSSEGSIYAGEPVSTTYPNKITVLENKGFIVGYDEKRKNPAWVAYKVEDCIAPQPPKGGVQGLSAPLGGGDSRGLCFYGLERPSGFDTDYRTRVKVRHSDYTRSGYDRGHMAPNFAISTRYGKSAQEETFLMSNIVPQSPNLNRGVWKRLEQQIANEYSKKLEEVWIITGPIYDDAIPDRFLKNGTEIPDRFYKIVLDEESAGGLKAKAYVIPQSVEKRARLNVFSVSVDEVEEQAGLDFFTLLDDEVEGEMETEV